jgi:hypothetical protein
MRREYIHMSIHTCTYKHVYTHISQLEFLKKNNEYTLVEEDEAELKAAQAAAAKRLAKLEKAEAKAAKKEEKKAEKEEKKADKEKKRQV